MSEIVRTTSGQFNIIPSDLTWQQIEDLLAARISTNKTALVALAIDRLWHQYCAKERK